MSRILAVAILGVAALPAPAEAAVQEPSFEALARRASAARDANRLDEAIEAYRAGLELRPDWDEGWWYVATVYYETDRHAEGRDAFAKLLELKPELGAAWILRGLCEFQLGQYAASLEHIGRGLEIADAGVEIMRVARYHEALLLIKAAQFELAVKPMTMLARAEPESLSLIEPIGLMLLRKALFPAEIAEADRTLIRRTGRVGYLHLARRGAAAAEAYAELVADFPENPWVAYAHAQFLLVNDADRGLEELRRAAELAPDEFYPHLEIAFELLRRDDPQGALGAAEAAVKLAPGLLAAQNAYGRALVGLGRYEEGIAALEQAAELAPESPEMFFSLARAYQKAGRREDAARARSRFAELEKQRQAAAQVFSDQERQP